MIRYFDASALVKRYASEAGNTAVRRLMLSGSVASSRLSEVEVVSALARRAREAAYGTMDRDRALTAWHRDLETFIVVEIVPDVTALARSLLVAHPLRAGDAIQLASCLHLRDELGEDLPFVAYDERLVEVARSLKLTVLGAGRAGRRAR